MKHRELVDKVLELEARLKTLEERAGAAKLPNYEFVESSTGKVTPIYLESLDHAYDPPLRQLDIEEDYQG